MRSIADGQRREPGDIYIVSPISTNIQSESANLCLRSILPAHVSDHAMCHCFQACSPRGWLFQALARDFHYQNRLRSFPQSQCISARHLRGRAERGGDIASCPVPAFHLQKDTAKYLGECYFAIFPRRINTLRRSDPVLRALSPRRLILPGILSGRDRRLIGM
jgi:hypothetical protein